MMKGDQEVDNDDGWRKLLCGIWGERGEVVHVATMVPDPK